MDEHILAERAVEKRSKIVQHPSAESSPTGLLAEGVGIAQSGQMKSVCVLWEDENGNYHIGWSKMCNTDLASYGVLLTHIAATRLAEYEPPPPPAKAS